MTADKILSNAVMCKILKTTLKVANFASIPIDRIGISVLRIQTVFYFSLLFSMAVPSGTENSKKVFDALFLKIHVILEIRDLIKEKHCTKMLTTLLELTLFLHLYSNFTTTRHTF